MSTARLILVTAANGAAILYEHDAATGQLLSSNQGLRADLEDLAAKQHPGAEIRHVPPQAAKP